MRIALVGCVKLKRTQPAPAQDLYISPLFRGMRAYAEQHANRWFILSAKHGVLQPAQIIEPYDETLVGRRVTWRRLWAQAVNRQLTRKLLPPECEVLLLAGSVYREYLAPLLRERHYTIIEPFKGLSLGQQLSRLKEY